MALAHLRQVPAFSERIAAERIDLSRRPLDTLQVNIGKRCNQACRHCHVESSPIRTENMDYRTIDRLLTLLADAPGIHTVDITGGAPELNPNFRPFVTAIRAMGKTVIDRCNLTVLFERGQQDTAEFLAHHGVQITASLPCYTSGNVDRQRGHGVFNTSVRALQKLNALGYGVPGSGLILNLVYNPIGPSLPPAQASLEADYRRELRENLGVKFSALFTITNMPIKRFLDDLLRQGKLDEYMALLVSQFNPSAASGVMCRSLVSIGWDGTIYDCDFNQMLELPAGGGLRSIWDIDRLAVLQADPIAIDNHCYGCTAGAGSSCGGALS
ncbi:MAG: radical SAM/Cys-rich protein [Myxococcota bacterium]|jgi:radical SAM/Cys-rich protein